MASVQNVTFSRNFFSVFPPGGREQYSHVMVGSPDPHMPLLFTSMFLLSVVFEYGSQSNHRGAS